MRPTLRTAFEPRRSTQVFAAAVAATVAMLSLASCTGRQESTSCLGGSDTATKVVSRFLDEVQRGDQVAAMELVTPGGTTSDSDWEALHAQLRPQDLGKIRLIEESETPSSRGVRVIDGQGKELTSFALTEAGTTGQCWTVNWGNYQPQEDPASQSAAPNA